MENLAVPIFIHKLLAKYVATKFVYQFYVPSFIYCRVYLHYLPAHNDKTKRSLDGAANPRLPRGNRYDVWPGRDSACYTNHASRQPLIWLAHIRYSHLTAATTAENAKGTMVRQRRCFPTSFILW